MRVSRRKPLHSTPGVPRTLKTDSCESFLVKVIPGRYAFIPIERREIGERQRTVNVRNLHDELNHLQIYMYVIYLTGTGRIFTESIFPVFSLPRRLVLSPSLASD